MSSIATDEGVPNPRACAYRLFRIYYATQTGNRPFRIRIFCNREEKLTEQYRRYLEAGLVEEFDLSGCPIYFDLVGKERHEDRAMPTGGTDERENRAPRAKWQMAEGREGQDED